MLFNKSLYHDPNSNHKSDIKKMLVLLVSVLSLLFAHVQCREIMLLWIGTVNKLGAGKLIS